MVSTEVSAGAGRVVDNGVGSLFVGPDFAGCVLLHHPDDIHAVLTQGEPDPLGDLEILEGLDPLVEPVAGPDAARFAAAALRPAAVDAGLDSLDRALRWQLRALARTEFDPVAVLPKVCARAVLPLCLDGPAPTLVAASVTAARTAVEYLDGGRGLPRWLPNRRLHRARDAQRRLRVETARAAEQRRSSRPAGCPHTVVDHLNDDSALARAGLPGRTLGSLAALATMVPGAALSWLVYELGRRPEDVRRIREEALARPTSLDGFELATGMPYTHAFAREVPRLHPPVWQQRRALPAPIRLHACPLPARQRVAFSPYLLHRDPRWWHEPEVFAPERWLAPGTPHVGPAYLPVGATRFGTRLGLTLLTLAAAQLSAEYDIRIRTPDAVTPRFGALLRPSRLRVRLDRRHG